MPCKCKFSCEIIPLQYFLPPFSVLACRHASSLISLSSFIIGFVSTECHVWRRYRGIVPCFYANFISLRRVATFHTDIVSSCINSKINICNKDFVIFFNINFNYSRFLSISMILVYIYIYRREENFLFLLSIPLIFDIFACATDEFSLTRYICLRSKPAITIYLLFLETPLKRAKSKIYRKKVYIIHYIGVKIFQP